MISTQSVYGCTQQTFLPRKLHFLKKTGFFYRKNLVHKQVFEEKGRKHSASTQTSTIYVQFSNKGMNHQILEIDKKLKKFPT
jgi:hypothetical protein